MSLSERVLTAGAGVCVFWGAYAAVGAVQVDAELHTLRSPLDVVPLMPWTVALYLFLYAQVVAPLAVISDRRVLRRGLACYALLVVSGMPFWWFFPVTVPREPVAVHDLWTYGLAVTRYVDPPTNCFPSMHVAESVAAAVLIWRHHKALGVAWGIGALAVAFSTLSLGQHWVADAVFGAVLGVAAVQFVFWRWPVPAEAERPLPLHHNLWPLLWFAVLFLGCAAPWWFGWVGPADLGNWGAPPPPAG